MRSQFEAGSFPAKSDTRKCSVSPRLLPAVLAPLRGGSVRGSVPSSSAGCSPARASRSSVAAGRLPLFSSLLPVRKLRLPTSSFIYPLCLKLVVLSAFLSSSGNTTSPGSSSPALSSWSQVMLQDVPSFLATAPTYLQPCVLPDAGDLSYSPGQVLP